MAVLSGVLAITGLLCPPSLRATDLLFAVTGNLVGSVVDAQGVPQLGASVQLLNKYHQAIATSTSDSEGRFAFADLPVDVYSLRATLTSFLPVLRDQVAVKAGTSSVLQIHLATLISSIQVAYTIPSSAMSDDWKWVLRSSSASRPINRYLPVEHSETKEETEPGQLAPLRAPIFSGVHAFVAVTGGDGGPLDSDSSFSDFGTAFAVSTQVYGKNRLQVSGSFGEDFSNATPDFGVSAVYSRSEEPALGRAPEITFTATQVAGIGSLPAPSPAGTTLAGASPSTVSLRSMSLSLYQVFDPASNVHLEYGVTGQSVDYLQHTSRLSPFARVTVDAGSAGVVIASYSDGGRPDQLLNHPAASVSESDLPADGMPSFNTTGRLPQISLRNDRLVLQRTRSFELGYSKRVRSRAYALSAFSEDVSDGRLSIAGNFGSEIAPNILSDTLSRTSVYNIGRYRRTGYVGSASQRLRGGVELGLAAGRMGAFSARPLGAEGVLPSDGSFLRELNASFASANLRASLPYLGTRIDADYGWIDSGTVMPRHLFTTQGASAAPGLNLYVRQPVPTFFGLPGRVELTADLRNLLAQGYLPLNTGEGSRMLIVQAPQSIRGGLNFIF